MSGSVPKIAYILGASRSGSTILDALLGAHRQVFAPGELYLLLRQDHWKPRRCSCDRLLDDCPVWGPILSRWHERIEPMTRREYLGLQEKFERFRSLPGLALATRMELPSLEIYRRSTIALLETVASRAGATVVADSSKHPPRALALLAAGIDDLALIHLVRDPRAVVWSKEKYYRRWRGGPGRPRQLALRTTLDWLLVNRFCEWMLNRYTHLPQVRVRYEDLATSPADTLRRIGAAIGLDLEAIARKAEGGEAFGFGHIMAGSRLRHQGARPIVVDLDWIESAPPALSRRVWDLTGWLAGRYGYRA